jgi:hypothetical protein
VPSSTVFGTYSGPAILDAAHNSTRLLRPRNQLLDYRDPVEEAEEEVASDKSGEQEEQTEDEEEAVVEEDEYAHMSCS